MKLVTLSLLLMLSCSLSAQKYFTKSGQVTFHSDAPMEKIEAENNKGTTVVDTETGDIQWAVLIKAFKFEKALMEEHFNENYMESSKFPKATFKGKISNMSDIDLKTNGKYIAKVSGILEIHGIAKEMANEATFTVTDGVIHGHSELKVALADHGIEIPSVVADNLSKVVDVVLNADYQLLAK